MRNGLPLDEVCRALAGISAKVLYPVDGVHFLFKKAIDNASQFL